MRKLYKKYFSVPEEGKGKVSEKVLLARIAATGLLIIICLAQMSFGAIAHFLGTYELKTRHIITAAYDLDCTVTSGGQSTIAKKITATDADTYPRTYEITLRPDSDNTASTGFCLVTVDYDSTALTAEDGVTPIPDYTYYTAQIGADETAQGGVRNTVTFTLLLNAPATVRLIPNWGVSTHYGHDIENAELFIEHGDVVAPPPPPSTVVDNDRPENGAPTTEPDGFETSVPADGDSQDAEPTTDSET